ncbi:DUF86 domain-containing protein [Cronbergia sp. UHCC 0137]|uniref:HepT-like ribonuclease domain-containing protein n=1 Tax=Cronbergia sp. UHCC 0137 TaxID=3110239 RepID=UPI002B1FCB25|nr:DUF86 domain-containing protein [Cronbergia sp. UHCC 0137]MEA5620495.1 DUF86 domain-containing protein [Cronbergia sp. UHCC 0137]
MSTNKDSASLIDIAQAAYKIIKYKQGLSRDEFMDDDKTQSSILYQLLIIGEATKRISQEFRVQNLEIPWSLMAGMRDNLIHEYNDTNLDEVWKTSDKDIPELIKLIEPLLPRKET